MAEILGGRVGFSREGGGDGGESVIIEGSGLGLGAKKREITCCFCFPIPAREGAGSDVPSGSFSVENERTDGLLARSPHCNWKIRQLLSPPLLP